MGRLSELDDLERAGLLGRPAVEHFIATAYSIPPPGQRRGQAAFNQLLATKPELAELVRGTKEDPFHDDERLTLFEAWLRDAWK